MRIGYKRSLSFIGFLIIICVIIGVLYLFYDRVIKDETVVLVDGNISANFISGNSIAMDGEYKFSITNNADKDAYYDITIDELKGYDKDLIYSLTSTEANINITNATLENDNPNIVEHIFIESGRTQYYVLNIKNNTMTTFELHVKTDENMEEYFYTTILKNNTIKKDATTKVGEDIATSSEGLIEDIDDYGLTYYFRGNVTNNYVSFANKTWRIVRINGDGTVRLVLDNLTGVLSNYHSSLEEYEDFSKTTIYSFLETFYDNELKSYDSVITNSKYCMDNESVTTDTGKNYNSYSRLMVDKIPTFNCLGEKYASKIGLITADEVVFAGANTKDENKEFYLYNSSFETLWWTSTLSRLDNNIFYPFAITTDGKVTENTNGTLYRGLRPVINLNKKVIVSGTGTSSDPYVVAS